MKNSLTHKDTEILTRLVGQTIVLAEHQPPQSRGITVVTASHESFVIGYHDGDTSLSVTHTPASKYRRTKHYSVRFNKARVKARTRRMI